MYFRTEVTKGDRVVIPQSLQQPILKQLHEIHLGITKMKQLARRYVYWQGIDADIEKLVKSCAECALVKTNPPKVPVHPWDTPANNWDRIHIDYAGPYQNCHFLVAVDAKSKWCEVRVCQQAPTTQSTIQLLDDIFAVHGFPLSIVSDNATIFVSDTFKQYCVCNGIRQKLIAPGHPATNGLAERNVQTLKQRLRAMVSDPTSL